jgi:pimeloyl-ACP methyl ester carboxylesterase
VHDIAYLYLDLIGRLDLKDVVLVGASFGGWVALELAVRSEARLERLVLIDTLGLKFGNREERDIADIYALPAEEVLRRSFVDPARVVPDYANLDDAELVAIMRDREATALYGWRPYMHDPSLVHWLHLRPEKQTSSHAWPFSQPLFGLAKDLFDQAKGTDPGLRSRRRL